MKRRQMDRLKNRRNGRFRNAIRACVNTADLLEERRSWFLLLERLNHTLMCSALRKRKLLPKVNKKKNSDTWRKNEKKNLEILKSYSLDASQEISNDTELHLSQFCQNQKAFSKKKKQRWF